MTTWTDKTLYDKITDKHDELSTDYAQVNRNRDLMANYFRSDELVKVDEKGKLLGQDIYNGAGSWYSRMMATGFQGSLVSKNIDWIRYELNRLELKGIDILDLWLQDVKEHMSTQYQRGNFYDVQPNFTHDGLTTGSPLMFGEEDILEEKVMWTPQHYSTVRIYYNKWNESEGVIVEDKIWTAKKIMDTFAKGLTEDQRKEKLSISVNQAIDTGQYQEKFTVYRATFKADDPIWDGTGPDAFKKPQGDWKWLTAYFLELTTADKSKQNKPLNDNMGDFTRPFGLWNFDKKFWECSSRTPAWYAVWDNLSLQQMDKNLLEDVQNKNRNAFIALNSMKGRVDLSPEGEMYGSQEEYENPPKFIDRVEGIDIEIALMEMKEDALKRWFYIDQLAMFSDLAFQKNQPITATQTIQMAGEKATLLSPAIETHSTYLKDIDARMIDVEVRAGRGPFDPQTMANITDVVLSNVKRPVKSISIRPVFIGRLAQAQKVSQELEPITTTLQAVAPLMDINPHIKLMYRWYETTQKINEALDFPQDSIVPKEEWEEQVAAANEAEAAQQRFENTIEGLKASKNIQGPVDDTSVLAGAAG